MTIWSLAAANAHKSNGLIENDNRMLRSLYNRSHQYNRGSVNEIILEEALFGKDITKGSNKASEFRLLSGGSLRMFPTILDQRSPSISTKEHTQHVAHRRVTKMLCAPIYTIDQTGAEGYCCHSKRCFCMTVSSSHHKSHTFFLGTGS